MAIAIEPCPFCRSNHLHLNHSGLSYCVVCQSCRCKGPHRDELETAIGRWNQTSRLVEELAPSQDDSRPHSAVAAPGSLATTHDLGANR